MLGREDDYPRCDNSLIASNSSAKRNAQLARYFGQGGNIREHLFYRHVAISPVEAGPILAALEDEVLGHHRAGHLGDPIMGLECS